MIPGGGPGPARKNEEIYQYSSGGEEEDAQSCPCGKAVETRTHVVAEYELHKEEPGVLEREMRNMNEGGVRY